MASKRSAYKEAGVDIEAKMSALKRVGAQIKRTRTAGALGSVGSFGGLFSIAGTNKILVSSIDGVGTKLKIAHLAERHDTIGQDLVNHCVNDILTQGAEPLFFLDYVGTSVLEPQVFEEVIAGICKACRQNGCTLIGGETAEMPGLYPRGEYDLVGTIVGGVEKKKRIDGSRIREGDVLIGLASSGLHTNGYSLAREVLFTKARLRLDDPFPGMKKKVGEVLLAIHRSYLRPIQALMNEVAVGGLAHITGGGLLDNVPRVLPDGLCAHIDRSKWKIPPVFQFIQKEGRVELDEMFRVFNMGIGMVAIVRPGDAAQAQSILKSYRLSPCVMGEIRKGKCGVLWSD